MSCSSTSPFDSFLLPNKYWIGSPHRMYHQRPSDSTHSTFSLCRPEAFSSRVTNLPPARHSWDRRSLCAVRLCTSTGRGTYRDKSYIPASQRRRSWRWSLGHDGGLWSSRGETQENPRRRLTNLPQRVKRSCLDAPDSPVISQFKCDGSTSRHILQTSPSKDNINTPIRRRHSNITSARRTTKHPYFIILHSYTQLYSINCTAS